MLTVFIAVTGKTRLRNQSMYLVPYNGCMFIFKCYLEVGTLFFNNRVSQSTCKF